MNPTRRLLASAPAKLAALGTVGAVAVAISVTAATGATATNSTFSFGLQASSAAISTCLPKASGKVTITTGTSTGHASFQQLVVGAAFAPHSPRLLQSLVRGAGYATAVLT